ncbi:hypothetical protein [Chamaesiphon sp. OTE_8_metabat_110]|uniref:hypothetical protein n=1 Tax=Chamaesiphon sp. OTE_8_metabat_110 TaxID=2964696 RepID=UPI00286A8827|nr:hypothetical protein [Chamaesiphon sp. OTE_8_metabat_110]
MRNRDDLSASFDGSKSCWNEAAIATFCRLTDRSQIEIDRVTWDITRKGSAF